VTGVRPVGEDDIQAFIDGRLPPGRSESVEAHLDADPIAAARVAADRQIRDALRSRLAFKAAEPIPPRLRVSELSGNRRRIGSVAAALLWMLAGAAAGWTAHEWRSGPAGAGGAIARDAIAAHRTFVVESVHPVEVAATQEQHLVQWLSKRLGRPLTAPALAGYGYRLMGGRLLSSERGPAAQFMYENGSGGRLTLYVHAGEGGATGFRFAQENEVSAFYWTEEGLGYAIAGQLDRDRLLSVAQAVYREYEKDDPPRGGSAP